MPYKSKVKFRSKLSDKEVTFIVDDELKPSPPKGAAARKLAEANEFLSKIKNLDAILKQG